MKPSFQEPRQVFERLKRRFGAYRSPTRGGVDANDTEPFGLGRDPASLSDAFLGLTDIMGWSRHLAQADLLAEWANLVGVDVAAHTTPVSSDHGIIEIHCDSSAWATQLRLIKGQLLATLSTKYPEADITELRIKAPGAPSWKHGSRSVPGRGPRDTYG